MCTQRGVANFPSGECLERFALITAATPEIFAFICLHISERKSRDGQKGFLKVAAAYYAEL